MSLDVDERALLAQTVAACDRLETSIGRLRTDYRRKIIRSNVAVGFVAIVTLLAAFVGYQARETSQRVDSEATERAVALNEARLASCVQSNLAVQAQRAAMVGALAALVPPGTELTATQKETLARYEKETADRLKFRDCSPAGVAAFLKDPPPDPGAR